MSRKIIFHDNSLSERGTSTAVFDYAFWGRELLDIDPVVCFDLEYQYCEKTLEKFAKHFKVLGYRGIQDLQKIADNEHADFFYAIKYGIKDHLEISGMKNLVHSVFNFDPTHIHGDVYAVVSEWQSYRSGNVIPYVPHMINLVTSDGDLRDQLGIPKNALVVGRHGAYDTFDLPFVIETITEILSKRSDIWFLFLNTEKKINHDRCIYLDKIVDPIRKSEFINTCDAMIHARSYGETFGLSVLEFAAKNKQIISYDNTDLQLSHPLGGRNHFLFLRDQCFKFSEKNDLGYLLLHLTRKSPFNTEFVNDDFSPKKVMSIFQDVFLK